MQYRFYNDIVMSVDQVKVMLLQPKIHKWYVSHIN
jgi:hypothetical protein